MKGPVSYRSQERAAEKAASRAQDQRALASGEKSAEKLYRENAFVCFPKEQIRIDYRRAKSYI